MKANFKAVPAIDDAPMIELHQPPLNLEDLSIFSEDIIQTVGSETLQIESDRLIYMLCIQYNITGTIYDEIRAHIENFRDGDMLTLRAIYQFLAAMYSLKIQTNSPREQDDNMELQESAENLTSAYETLNTICGQRTNLIKTFNRLYNLAQQFFPYPPPRTS